MKCPFTHTGCDRECELYNNGCTFTGVIVQVCELLGTKYFGTTDGLYKVEVKDASNGKKGKREKTLEDSGESDGKGSGVKRKPSKGRGKRNSA